MSDSPGAHQQKRGWEIHWRGRSPSLTVPGAAASCLRNMCEEAQRGSSSLHGAFLDTQLCTEIMWNIPQRGSIPDKQMLAMQPGQNIRSTWLPFGKFSQCTAHLQGFWLICILWLQLAHETWRAVCGRFRGGDVITDRGCLNIPN